MSDNWKFGITGLIMIIVGFVSIIAIIDIDIDYRVVLEVVALLFFLAVIAAGAKMCLIALDE